MMVTPCLTTTSPGSVSSQLPPCSAARSTMTLPGFIDLHHLGGDQLRRGLAGDQRGGDDDVHFLRLLGEHLALGLLEAFAHHLGVAAAAGAFLLVVDLHELAAQRLHLVGHFGARVVGAHDGAQADGGADRRQARDAGADDEHLGRRHLARGGDLAGEEAAEVRAPPRSPRGSRRCWPSRTARPASARARCAARCPSPARWPCAPRAAASARGSAPAR